MHCMGLGDTRTAGLTCTSLTDSATLVDAADDNSKLTSLACVPEAEPSCSSHDAFLSKAPESLRL
jgi:hypothetical protein